MDLVDLTTSSPNAPYSSVFPLFLIPAGDANPAGSQPYGVLILRSTSNPFLKNVKKGLWGTMCINGLGPQSLLVHALIFWNLMFCIKFKPFFSQQSFHIIKFLTPVHWGKHILYNMNIVIKLLTLMKIVLMSFLIAMLLYNFLTASSVRLFIRKCNSTKSQIV